MYKCIPCKYERFDQRVSTCLSVAMKCGASEAILCLSSAQLSWYSSVLARGWYHSQYVHNKRLKSVLQLVRQNIIETCCLFVYL